MRAILTVLALVVTACSPGEPPLVATDVLIKAPPPGIEMSAGYLTLHNNTAQAITITGVSSPQFGAVEMHETRIRDGIARMVALEKITVPARQSVVFAPAARHLMLMRPAGEPDAVSLEFYSGPDRVLTLEAAVTR